jgi:hypothetical protein
MMKKFSSCDQLSTAQMLDMSEGFDTYTDTHLDLDEWSTSLAIRLSLGERAAITHWM